MFRPAFPADGLLLILRRKAPYQNEITVLLFTSSYSTLSFYCSFFRIPMVNGLHRRLPRVGQILAGFNSGLPALPAFFFALPTFFLAFTTQSHLAVERPSCPPSQQIASFHYTISWL
jgi:hypothetical protein